MWIRGNSPAVITANTVITSATRYTAVRQPDRNRNRIAEMSVPECAIPTQNTKQVMNTAQYVGIEYPASPRP